MSLRVVFLGTGRLAQPVFEALCQSAHQVVGLVTQPDRTGPGHHRHRNPLKEFALERRIPVLQPVRIKLPESVQALRELAGDVFVVAAYGQILSREILDLPRLGVINVHASLLPKYRGATPIHATVLNGDAEAGVTIIRLVPELDAGPMLGFARTPLGPDETTGQLEARLAELGAPLTLAVLAQLEAGTAVETMQDATQATHVGKLTKADGRIDWAQPAAVVRRHILAMQPWPGPFTTLHTAGKPPLRLQILQCRVNPAAAGGPPGQILSVSAEGFSVACGEQSLDVLQVHPDGKRPMSAAEFLRGRPLTTADRCE